MFHLYFILHKYNKYILGGSEQIQIFDVTGFQNVAGGLTTRVRMTNANALKGNRTEGENYRHFRFIPELTSLLAQPTFVCSDNAFSVTVISYFTIHTICFTIWELLLLREISIVNENYYLSLWDAISDILLSCKYINYSYCNVWCFFYGFKFVMDCG